MAKSLFNQFSQIRGSRTYLDNLNLTFAELSGRNYEDITITTVAGNADITASTSFAKSEQGNFIVVSGTTTLWEITAVSGTTATVSPTPSSNLTDEPATKYYYKNLEDDLNYIRSQLLAITGETEWTTEPDMTIQEIADTLASGVVTTFIDLTDTYVSSFTDGNTLYTSSSGVHDTSDLTYDSTKQQYTTTVPVFMTVASGNAWSAPAAVTVDAVSGGIYSIDGTGNTDVWEDIALGATIVTSAASLTVIEKVSPDQFVAAEGHIATVNDLNFTVLNPELVVGTDATYNGQYFVKSDLGAISVKPMLITTTNEESMLGAYGQGLAVNAEGDGTVSQTRAAQFTLLGGGGDDIGVIIGASAGGDGSGDLEGIELTSTATGEIDGDLIGITAIANAASQSVTGDVMALNLTANDYATISGVAYAIYVNSGFFRLGTNTAVDDIVVSITEPGSDEHLVTEKAVVDYVGDEIAAFSTTFSGLDDTPSEYYDGQLLRYTTTGLVNIPGLTWNETTDTLTVSGTAEIDGDLTFEGESVTVNSIATSITSPGDNTTLVTSSGIIDFVESSITSATVTGTPTNLFYADESTGVITYTDNMVYDSGEIRFGESDGHRIEIGESGVSMIGDENNIITVSGGVTGAYDTDGLVLMLDSDSQHIGLTDDTIVLLNQDTDTITMKANALTQLTVTTSGITLASGTNVNDIVTTIAAPYSDNALVTEQAIYEYVGTSVGNATFSGLTDTPSAYAGSANQLLRVNSTPDAVIFEEDLVYDGTELTVGGNVDITGNMTLSGTSVVAGDATFESNVDIEGDLNVDGAFGFDSTATTVSGIVDSMTEPGSSTNLVTENGIVDYVTSELSDAAIFEIVDTPYRQIRQVTTLSGFPLPMYYAGDVAIIGNLTVSGTEFIANTETVLIEDNMLVVNNGETGPGVTSRLAGIQVDRGTQLPYYFVFDEVYNNFRVGVSGTESGFADTLQAVATREDGIGGAGSTWDGRVPFWDADDYIFRLKGNTYLVVNSGTQTIEVVADTDTKMVIDPTTITMGSNIGNDYIKVDSSGTPEFSVFMGGNREFIVTSSGLTLDAGATVDQILDSSDDLSAGTDSQLITAALAYQEISSLSGTVGALTFLDLTDTPAAYNADNFVQSTASGIIMTTIDHNSDLQSLQGGTVDQYYHMTQSENSAISSDGTTFTISQLFALSSGTSVNDITTAIAAPGDDNTLVTEAGIYSHVNTVSGVLQDQIDDADEIKEDRKEPTGYVNRTDSAISFDDATRTFTISGTSFEYYIHGEKFTGSGDYNVSIPGSNAEGDHFFYFDNTGTLQTATDFDPYFLYDVAYTASIYWDETNDEAIYMGDERHGIIMDADTHRHLHYTVGTAFISGLGLSNFSISTGANDVDAQFDIAGGTIVDEDIYHTITGITMSGTGIRLYYKDGANGNWRRDASDNAPVDLATDRIYWNEYTGGAWQKSEVSTNGYFTLAHIFATNDPNNQLIAVMGQSEYSTAIDAREGANTEMESMNLAGLPFQEMLAIATVIYETNSAFGNTWHARVVQTDTGDDYVDWRYANISPSPGSISDHGNLSGLTDPDHPASAIYTNTSNFDGVLDSSDDTVQKALDSLDDTLGSTGHTHYDMDATWSGSSVWTITDGGIVASSVSDMEVFLNGLKNKNDVEYYTSTVIDGKITIAFAYDTYDEDWVNVTFTQSV